LPLRKSFNANDLIFLTVEDGLEGVRAPEVDRIRLTNYAVDGPPAWAARGAATEYWLNSNKGTKTLTGLSPKALKQPSDLFVVVEPPYSVGPPIDQYLQLSKLAIEWKELQAASKR
jgi:hypothetical protein